MTRSPPPLTERLFDVHCAGPRVRTTKLARRVFDVFGLSKGEIQLSVREFGMGEEGVSCEPESTRIAADIKDEEDFKTEEIRCIFVIGQSEFF